MNDVAAPTQSFTLQLAVTVTAMIHPEPDASGFSAEIPALPGCNTHGETLEEVQANLKEAAEAWLASGKSLLLAVAKQESFRKWVARLQAMRQLRKEDAGGAPAPDAETLTRAEDFLGLLQEEALVPNQVAPSVVGGVGITIRGSNRKVYVEFNNKGNVLGLFSDGVTAPIVEKIEQSAPAYRSFIQKGKAYLDE